MRRRIIFIVIALFLAVGTIFLARQLLGGRFSKTPSGAAAVAPTASVLVASAELPAGSIIAATSLRWQAWPAGLSTGYFVEGATKIADFAGAVVRSRLAAGEPLTAGEVVHPGERGFMAAVLTPGDRAVTIPITASTGVAGFPFPGDRVDLILTMVSPLSSGAGVARHVSGTFLTDLRIVGMDQNLSDDKKPSGKVNVVSSTATLEVTPKQAEVVAVASQLGVLSLSLRSLGNSKVAESPSDVSQTWDNEAMPISFAAPPTMVANRSPGPMGGAFSGVAASLAPPGATPSAAGALGSVNQRRIIVVRGSDVSEFLFQPPRSRWGGRP
jgi:pilus assembly protein CpaB